MMEKRPDQKVNSLSLFAIISFLMSLIFCTFLISAAIINRTNIELLIMEQQIFERAQRISEIINKLLYKTQTLSAIVVHDRGRMDSFDSLAPSLVDDPVIKNIILAPNGIVTKIYPLEENQELIGWDYFDGRAGNREALAAKNLRALVLGGPIEIIQGGNAIFGRLPVFIDTPPDGSKFWGLVSVTLKFPQVLEHAQLDIFNTNGYMYELWRVNPDTNEKQVLSKNYSLLKPNSYSVERPIFLPNAVWYLKASSVNLWYTQPENIALIAAGFFISLIVFFVMQNNYQLKNMESFFEHMAITDSLTGIFNRRHFLEIVRINIEKSRRHNENCFFIMFDIDKFKNINDTYGHQIGDKVLMDVTARVKADIRPYDLFGRYGGEEFVLFISGISRARVFEMIERLRTSVCGRKYEYDSVSFDCSASFGIAHMDDYNLDKAIKQSDDAMYAAKKNGRNCVVFYNDITS